MGMNTVLFYVEKSTTTELFMKTLMSSLGTDYENYSEDGVDYYKFRVSRPNHFSMSNGTATKIEFDDPYRTVEEYAGDIKTFVDNIV
jgi:hypothetical protein